MAVIDHGFWVKYIPVTHPEDVPRGAAFCRRQNDNQDWYEYVNVNPEFADTYHKGRRKQFGTGTVKLVVEMPGQPNTRATEVGEPVIRTVSVDETRLFPQDCQLVELVDVIMEQDEEKLIEAFVNRHVDLKTGKLGKKWEPPRPEPQPIDDRVADALEMILERLEKLEQKK